MHKGLYKIATIFTQWRMFIPTKKERVKSMKKIFKQLVAQFLCAAIMVVTVLSSTSINAAAADNNLLNTYGSYFGRVGTCINLSQLQNSNTLNHVKSQYNSITLENEMKPDAMLGYSANLISVEQAISLGY